MKTPKVVVFDLGKVLVDFDYSIAVSRIIAHSTVSLAGIRAFLLQSHAMVDYEGGRLTRKEFFEQACKATGFRGSMEDFCEFFADIFTPISPMIELHAEVRQKGIPTYVFSNTNDLAIEHVRRNFPFFKNFDGYIFSYEVGAMKPNSKIYEAMEKLTGRRGEEMVYLDDSPENVAAGATRGWQAILHETPGKTRVALVKMGLLNDA